MYTPRIYTGSPWSFTFNYYVVEASRDLGSPSLCRQVNNTLTSDFQTLVHNSAYLTFHNVRWKTRVYISDAECLTENVTCASLQVVNLKIEKRNNELHSEIEKHIGYSSRLVIECEGRYVVHVDEFNGENFVYAPSSAEQVCPCHSNLFYCVVVRPQ